MSHLGVALKFLVWAMPWPVASLPMLLAERVIDITEISGSEINQVASREGWAKRISSRTQGGLMCSRLV